MGSNLDSALDQLADALGVPAGTYYLGDGSYLLPRDDRDGPGAALLRQNRVMYIRDEFGTVGHAILDQSAPIPYMENQRIAEANYQVEVERRNRTLYIMRLSVQAQRQMGGESLRDQQANANAFTTRKQLDILRVAVAADGANIIEIPDIYGYEDPITITQQVVASPTADVGEIIDSITAGYHLLAIPYIDSSTGSLLVLTGTEELAADGLPDKGAFQIGEVLALAATLPPGAVPSFPMYLYAGQTISEDAFYRDYDLRPIVQPYHAVAASPTTIATKTANYTLATSDYTVLVDATGGAVTITLPPAADAYNSSTGVGKIYNVKKIDSSGNAIILDGDGSETIDGATTQSIGTQWMNLTVQSNGSAWFII